MRLYPLLLAGLLGCNAQPVIQTVTVKVPVATPCLTAVPSKPSIMPLEQILALPDYEAIIQLAQDHLKAIDYQKQIDAILIPCIKP